MSEKSTALFVAGLACYWPLLRRNGLQTLFSGHGLLQSDVLMLTCTFLVFSLVATVGMVAAKRPLGELLRRKPRWILLIAAVWMAVKVLSFLEVPRLGPALALADSALFSVGFVFLGIAWGDCSVRLPGDKTATYAILSFFFSFVVQQLCAFSAPATMAFYLISPVLSLACWFAMPAVGSDRTFAANMGAFTKLPLGLIVLLIAFLLVGSLFRGFFATPLSPSSAVGGLSTQNFLTIMLTLALLLISMRLPGRTRLVNVAWVVVAVAFFAGLFLIALLNPQEHDIGTNITVMARTCMTLLYWITLVNTAKRAQVSPILTFGLLFVLCDVASSALGYLVPGFFPWVQSVGESNPLPIALACAFMLLVASMAFLSSQAARSSAAASAAGADTSSAAVAVGSRAEAELADDPATSANRIVGAIAGEFGLTPRETEVAQFLARGYSQKKISEVLVVSDGTTQSHVKSIYRKLDVHSKQEFIDLVERRSGSQPRS